MTIAAKKVWTDEELLAMPKDGYEREIVNGELIVSPAGPDHGVVIGNIFGPLQVYVAANKLGKVFDGQTGCRMSSGDLLSPDISFATNDRWLRYKQSGQTFFDGSPYLVIEVLSPSDTLGVTEDKIAQYFQNGARLAWIVQPRTQRVFVYHGPAADKMLTPADTLDGEDVAPGFRLPLESLFS